jgi:3-phosphoshikimate 1-carboxyvinyltransferase
VTTQLVVWPASGPLRGGVPLPSAEAVLLPRVALAALCRGRTTFEVRGRRSGLCALLAGLAALGVEHVFQGERLELCGAGLFGLGVPSGPLDVRGEAPAGALLAGLLLGQPGASELWVDLPLEGALAGVLSAFGGSRVGWREDLDAGGRLLLGARAADSEGPPRGVGASLEVLGATAWPKQVALLAALRAGSPSHLVETLESADHLERACERARVPLERAGTALSLHPPRDADALGPTSYDHVGSATLGAYVAAAALLVPGSEVALLDVSLNPSGPALASALSLAGYAARAVPGRDRQGEPTGRLVVGAGSAAARRGGPLVLGGEAVVRLGDAALPLAASAATGLGELVLTDVVPLGRGADRRVLGRVAGLLASAGVPAEAGDFGLRVTGLGGKPLRALRVTTGGDGRLALLATVLALAADGPSVIDDVECLRDAFPRWVGTLRALGARLEVREA